MILVNCPETPAPELGRFARWVFLAGGITGCGDWQSDAIKQLDDAGDIVVLNPRRANFDANDSENEHFQIAWEHKLLVEATYCMFWFPKETLCPITLFELGKWLGWGKRGLVVGCDPEYQRRRDVQIQTELMRPGFYVHDSLEETVAEMKRKLA